jgi:hypothetical protein
MIPLAPSTKIFRASAAVGATSATRFAVPAVTFSRTNSTNARVFPKPRPASNNQMNQSSPAGGRWLGRAKIGQLSNSSSAVVKSVRFSIDIEHLQKPLGSAIFRRSCFQTCRSRRTRPESTPG